MKTLFNLFGVDMLAGMVALLTFGAIISIYLSYRLRHWGSKTVSDEFAPPKPPACPGCSRNLEEDLDVRASYAGFQQRYVTCECLTVSQWDINGHPVCLTWRPPTLEEIKHSNDLKVFREQAAAIEERRRVSRAVRRNKFRR